MNGGLTLCRHCGALEPPTVSAFRTAAQTAAGTDDWLAANAAELLAACRWLSVHDEALAALLARRPRVRPALHSVMGEAWADPERDVTEALDVTEFVALWGRPHSLPAGFSKLLKHGLAAAKPEAQNEIYVAVLACLRPTFGGAAGAGLRRVGWIYLLADAANAAHQVRDEEASTALWDEAWQLIDELPPYHEASTAAVGHIATGYATAVGALSPQRADWDVLLNIALERLMTAARRTEGNAASTALAAHVVRLGLSQTLIWYRRSVNGLVGWITAGNRRLELAEQAERAMWKYLPPREPAFCTHDPADLPEDLKAAVARLHLEIAEAAANFDRDRSAAAAQTALRLSVRPHHRFGALIGIARIEPNLAQRVVHYEQLLRETHNDLYGKVSSWRQGWMSARLADACRDLGMKLTMVGRPTAAWFWRREGASWSTRSRSAARVPQSARSLDTEMADVAPSRGDEMPVNGAADGGTTAPIARLVRNIETENVPGLVLNAMTMATGPADMEVLQAASAAIDDWQPDLRRRRLGRLEPAERRTADDFRRSLLESADELAAGYAAYLRPELLNMLSRQAVLGQADRLAVAEEALAVSLEAARWTEAIQALRVILAVAVDAADGAATAYSVHAICGIIQYAVTQSRGTADLIDVARQMTEISTRVATFLATRGHAELAFHAAHAGLGAINRIFAEDAQLIEEFELAEQFHQQIEGADDQLFEVMRRRLDSGMPPTSNVTGPAVYQSESLLACMPGPATYVQLFGNRKGGFWAVGCVVDDESRRWWATRLDVTTTSLSQLRQAVWHSLRPKRTGQQRSTQALGQLYTEIVGRFRG